MEAGANRPGAREVASGTWATRQTVNPGSFQGLSPRLHPGEREALALARELGCLLLIDDGTGRKEARRLSVRYITSLTVLRDAKRLGLIDAVKPTLDLLIAHDFWLGPAVYQEFLNLNGEA